MARFDERVVQMIGGILPMLIARAIMFPWPGQDPPRAGDPLPLKCSDEDGGDTSTYDAFASVFGAFMERSDMDYR